MMRKVIKFSVSPKVRLLSMLDSYYGCTALARGAILVYARKGASCRVHACGAAQSHCCPAKVVACMEPTERTRSLCSEMKGLIIVFMRSFITRNQRGLCAAHSGLHGRGGDGHTRQSTLPFTIPKASGGSRTRHMTLLRGLRDTVGGRSRRAATWMCHKAAQAHVAGCKQRSMLSPSKRVEDLQGVSRSTQEFPSRVRRLATRIDSSHACCAKAVLFIITQ